MSEAACKRKKKYYSESTANSAIESLKRKRKVKHGPGFNKSRVTHAYKCKYCKFHHLTSWPKPEDK